MKANCGKYLFITTTIALMASHASAADAIVAAEPEPTEYVKICDYAGTGYFYIPGTETCLKIGGFFEYRNDYNFRTNYANGKFSYELRFDSKNETEYGDAYSQIRFKGTTDNNNKITTNDVTGYMGLGGFEMGIYDNQWQRFLLNGGFTIADGTYGGQTNQYVSYIADFGNKWLAMGVVDWLAPNKGGYVLAAKYRIGGGWNVAAGFAYDDNVYGYTAKAALLGRASDSLRFKLMGFYANKANNYNNNAYAGFSVLGTVKFLLTDEFNINATAQWMEGNGYFLAGNLRWEPQGGIQAIAEVDYKSTTKTTTGIFRLRHSF